MFNTCRESGIILAETVNHIAVSMMPAVAPRALATDPVSRGVMPSGASPIDPVTLVTDAASPDTIAMVAHAAAAVSPVAAANFHVSIFAKSLTAGDATAQSLKEISTDVNPFSALTVTDDSSDAAPTPTDAVVTATVDATAHSSAISDIASMPADTVKKRRRTASWKFGANGPTIVSVTDDVGQKKRTASRKKNTQSQIIVWVTDNVEQQEKDGPWKDNFNGSSSLVATDVSLEKLVASWKEGITGVGQEFKSVYEFRDALQKYAIAHRFVYRLKKNDTNRASGRCVAEGCSWRIHASWVPAAQSFRIKKMTKSHTCGGQSWKSVHPAKNWLVNIIKDRLQDSPHHKPKDIAKCIFQDFGIELNYTQVWRGIEDAREQLQGSYKEAYNLLPWFCEKLMETNPGSIAKLLINDDKRFERLFVSFRASLHGFKNGCRPLLYLDATSLKSKYREILLIATAVDGNEGSFPVAFAIVDVETDDNWSWFLEQLKSAISTLQQPITFVSDREKGLKRSVLEIFVNAHHGYSIYHLMENFKKNLKGPFHGDGRSSLPINFLAAVHATRLDGFRKFTEEIKRVSSKAYNWVMQIEPECWTTALFEGEHYNQITVDVIHTYINLIEEVRELPITQKMEVLVHMMMDSINTSKTDSSTWSSKLTPSKEEKLQDEIIKARSLKVLFSSDTLFEVHDDSINMVNIDSWDCSCLQWKATGLPCCHAIAVFNCTGRSVYDYCSRYFTLDSFQLTYSESINPLPSIKSLDKEEAAALQTANVLPPCILRPQGRQRRKTIKTEEVTRRAVSCTRCKLAGHNKATCKAT